jgi:hypothetical protein
MKQKKTTKKTFAQKSVELNRHQLGSINLNDRLVIHTLKGTARTNYIRSAELVFVNEAFKNEIKALIQAQLEFIANQASDFDQVLFGRGTINGLFILEEVFEKYHNEFIELTKQPEDFDRFEIS